MAVRFLVLALAVFGAQFSYAAGEGYQAFTLDGVLYANDNFTDPLLDPSVQVKVQILNPARDCVLYEESQTISTQATNGHYNVKVGSDTGSAKRTGNDPGNAMIDILQNVVAINAINAGCGGVYNPATGHERYLRVTFTPSSTSTPETLTPDLALTTVPNALVCESVQGLDRDKLAEFGTHLHAGMTAGNLLSLFDGSDVAGLHNHDGEYAKLNNSNSINLGSQQTIGFGSFTGAEETAFVGTLGPADAGKSWYNSTTEQMMYWDGDSHEVMSSGGGAVTQVFGRVGNVVATASDYDAAQVDNAPAGGVAATNVQAAIDELDSEKLALAGGTMAGALDMGGNLINDVTDPASAQDAATKAYVDSAVSGLGNGDVLLDGNTEGANITIGTTDNFDMNFESNDTTRMTIENDGDVGIGTVNPGSMLEVNGPAEAITAGKGMVSINSNTAQAVGVGGTMSFGGHDGTQFRAFANIGGLKENATSGNYSAYMSFATRSNGSLPTEKMRITSDGKVGIGTASPNRLVSIKSQSGADDTLFEILQSDDDQIFTVYNTQSQGGSISLRNSSGVETTRIDGRANSTRHSFINNGGNLGLGLSDPATKLDLDGGISFRQTGADPAVSVAGQGRIYYDNSDNKFKISENNGAYIDLVGSGSSLDEAYDAGRSIAVDAGAVQLTGSNAADETLEVTNSGNGGALLVENTGTGDSFRVNDSAGDTSPFVIKDDGKIAIGLEDPDALDFMTIKTAGAVPARIGLQKDDMDHGMTVLSDTDNVLTLGTFNGPGDNGAMIAGYSNAADYPGVTFYGVVGSATPDADTPGFKFLSMKKAGTSGGQIGDDDMAFMVSNFNIDRFFIQGNGDVGLNVADPTTQLDMDGAITIRQTGADPAVSAAGQGRIYFDTSDSKFKFSENGGAYVELTSAGSDDLGDHEATQNIDLNTFKLVGNDGSTGLAIANGGAATFDSTVTATTISLNNGTDATVVGEGATGGTRSVTLGKGATSNSTDGIAIGQGATSNSSSISIGRLTTSSSSGGIAIGQGAVTPAGHTLVMGGDSGLGYLTDGYFGRGATSATPNDFTFHATGGLGTDIAGANMTLAGGVSTGTGAGGYLSFETTPAGGASNATPNTSTERMRILSDGKVGVGTTTPNGKFTVYGDGFDPGSNRALVVTNQTNGVTMQMTPTGGNGYIGTTTNHALGLQTNGVTRMSIAFGGTHIETSTILGVQEASPEAHLEVSADGTTGGAALMVSATDNGDGDLLIVNEDGKVGVGTTSASSRLHVEDIDTINDTDYSGSFRYGLLVGNGVTDPDGNNAILMGSGSFGNNPMVRMKTSAGDKGYVGWGVSQESFFVGVTGPNDMPLKLKTDGSDRMTILNSGEIGIGLTDPATAIDMDGAISFRQTGADPAVSVAGQGRIYYDNSDNKFKVSENNGAYVNLVGSGGADDLGDHEATQNIDLNTFKLVGNDGTDGIAIDATGRVGIGVTALEATVHVTGSASQSALLIDNTAADGDSTIRFRFPGDAEWTAGMDDGDGNKFKIADANSLGTASDKFTIDTAGNVGIGETSPTDRLHVHGGDIRIGVPLSNTAYGLVITNESAVSNKRGILRYKNDDFYITGHVGNQNMKIGTVYNSTGSHFAKMFFDINSNQTESRYSFSVDNDEKFTIDETGNVGIGVNDPNYLLEIYKAGAVDKEFLRLNTATHGHLNFRWDHSDTRFKIEMDNGTPDLEFFSSGGDFFFNGTSAKVGLGLTDPATRLDLDGAISYRQTGADPAVSVAGQGRIYYDNSENKFKVSENNGAYVDLLGGGGGASDVDGLNDGISDTTDNSIYIGDQAGAAEVATMTNNTVLGHHAFDGVNDVDADNNTAIGSYALSGSTDSEKNTAIGSNAMQLNAGGNDNTALGFYAGRNITTGYSNVAVGANAIGGFSAQTEGYNNVAVGFSALYNLEGGDANVGLGNSALNKVDSGNNNIAVGDRAGNDITSGSNNIIIGTNIDPLSNTGSNQLSIANILFSDNHGAASGNTIGTGNIGIGDNSPEETLTVAGGIKIGTAEQATAGTLQYTGGNLQFHNGSGFQTVSTGGDDLGDHEAGQNIDLNTHKLVGNNGTTGLSIANGGAVTSDGVILIPDGDADDPGIAFSDDNNTGFFSAFDGIINISSNGATVGYFDNSSIGFNYQVINTFPDWAVAAYNSSSVSVNVPAGVAVRSEDGGGNINGGFIGSSWAPANSGGTLQRAYFGASSNSAGNTPTIVMGQQTGANAYDEVMRVDENGKFGFHNDSPTAFYTFNGPSDITATSGWEQGIFAGFDFDPGSAASTNAYGAQFKINKYGSQNSNGTMIAVQGDFLQNHSGTTYLGIGVEGVTYNLGGTLDNAVGVRGSTQHSSTNAMAFEAVVAENAGTIVNGYGLYITDIDATNQWGIYQSHSSDDNYFAGDVGIGVTNPSEKLHVVGNLRVQGSTDCTLGNGSGATNCSSDERLKDNITPISGALEKIHQLKGVNFTWNNQSRAPGKQSIGVIAQDVQKVFPSSVIEHDTGYLAVDYASLVAPLIQATKELDNKCNVSDEQIASIKSRVGKNEREIASLKAENAELKKQLEKQKRQIEEILSRLK